MKVFPAATGEQKYPFNVPLNLAFNKAKGIKTV